MTKQALLASLGAAYSGLVATEPSETEPYLVDWQGLYKSDALCVAFPSSTLEVAQIVKWCASKQIAIVPQGGNTGLAGGCIPTSANSIVVSFKRMNQILEFDSETPALVVQAGCTLRAVQIAAEAQGFIFPLSLAAEGSCTIGGNLSTNAGGIHVLRYGSARELCLGLEIVLADGQIANGLRKLRKDNFGYSLKDIFIGSEGTLGIITAASLRLFAKPKTLLTYVVQAETLKHLAVVFDGVRSYFGFRLNAFELISSDSLTLVSDALPDVRLPLGTGSPIALIQVEASPKINIVEEVEDELASLFERSIILDAAVAQSIREDNEFWTLRESIPEAQMRWGYCRKHDISVPVGLIADFVVSTTLAIKKKFPALRLSIFGHMGDGNLHFNILSAERGTLLASSTWDDVTEFIHDSAMEIGGSITAEHGVGQLRRNDMLRYKSSTELAMMTRLKVAFDPQQILNPGKVIPDAMITNAINYFSSTPHLKRTGAE